jgi:hypothetical protein
MGAGGVGRAAAASIGGCGVNRRLRRRSPAAGSAGAGLHRILFLAETGCRWHWVLGNHRFRLEKAHLQRRRRTTASSSNMPLSVSVVAVSILVPRGDRSRPARRSFPSRQGAQGRSPSRRRRRGLRSRPGEGSDRGEADMLRPSELVTSPNPGIPRLRVGLLRESRPARGAGRFVAPQWTCWATASSRHPPRTAETPAHNHRGTTPADNNPALDTT